MQRGEIYWVNLPDPVGSGLGYPRPMLLIQADYLNASRLPTAVFCVLSSNMALARFPANVPLRSAETGLPKDSVMLSTELLTVDHSVVGDLAGRVPNHLMLSVDTNLRLVLGL